MSFERARKVADAVLYEGYVLYPYRASSRKNRLRWQFGVLAPCAWSEAGGMEAWWSRTECLLEPEGRGACIDVKVRFLRIRTRTIEQALDPAGRELRPVDTLDVEGRLWTSWDEGLEGECDVRVELDAGSDASVGAPGSERRESFSLPASREEEWIRSGDGRIAGRLVRESAPLAGVVWIEAHRAAAAPSLLRLSIRVENLGPVGSLDAPRESAVRSFLVGTHVLLAAKGGSFVSLLDPPEWAREAAADCINVRTWPVLVGDPGSRDVVLSSPIILQDYPEVAPESPQDLCDATEIDEILSLRTLVLTDEEKREARATDPRAGAIIDRIESMPQEVLDRLHGAVRYLRGVTGGAPEEGKAPPAASADPELAPWWDPGSDASVSPDTDAIEVRGVRVARGTRVRLRPGVRGADAQDMFLDGRIGRVEALYFDVDERNHLAVSLEDDPMAEIQASHGRYLYFSPDEVEPLGETP